MNDAKEHIHKWGNNMTYGSRRKLFSLHKTLTDFATFIDVSVRRILKSLFCQDACLNI